MNDLKYCCDQLHCSQSHVHSHLIEDQHALIRQCDSTVHVCAHNTIHQLHPLPSQDWWDLLEL
jgi:hypothetical protein